MNQKRASELGENHEPLALKTHESGQSYSQEAPICACFSDGSGEDGDGDGEGDGAGGDGCLSL